MPPPSPEKKTPPQTHPKPATTDAEKFAAWLAELSPQARHQVRGTAEQAVEHEEASAFQHFRDGLSDAALAEVAADAEQRAPFPPDRKPQYLLFVAPDGEWPRVETFPTAEARAARVLKLDGTDTNAFAAYGILEPITKADPYRAILLHDNRVAHLGPGGVRVADALERAVTVQEDGFLGPPELSIGKSVPRADDDEDDDPEDGEADGGGPEGFDGPDD